MIPLKKEAGRQVEEGILRPWEEDEKNGVLPLTIVVQLAKNKVRQVLDFRELNEHVACYMSSDVADV